MPHEVGLRLQANLGSFYYIDSILLTPQQNNHLLMLANCWMKLPQVIDIYIIFENKLNTANDGICDISCAFQVSSAVLPTYVYSLSRPKKIRPKADFFTASWPLSREP
ncbi:hypothetical protein OYC61_016590 [Alcaligenes nematophilus]|uniref:Uncharacterized protein n=1 Tax=Alcaligenes nematophilus TaxID=2994643 RepID=A0ABU3MX62_9BURK|nr:hypothetical protein [Alcaligenes nematophilus]MDT8465320.1 hypothetical protein [Alcaligenes nematophilus]MDT8470235.1 hypothetical protein [Alcaligenes nematophilus]MDT8505920.1 hypothetical protein [Alcaligenes nematophilus]MDT8526538.1 hypothetical protein [Alcaligenes nematophilus]